jgi:EmrB/QacA subfamily drug resistance transporter
MTTTPSSTEALKTEQQPAQFSHADILKVLYGLMICVLLAALDQTAVIPAVPAMANDLGGYTQLSWVVAAYLITSTISTPIYAKLSDTHGRRTLLNISLAIFIITSVLCGAAQTFGQLVWLRALQGLGGGGLMALTQAAIADVVSPRERGRYQAYISAAWATASLSGPLVGGFVTEHASWRWIFWINLPIGLAAMWMCHKGLSRLRKPVHPVRPRFDIPGMFFLTGALLSLLLALGWGGTEFAWGSVEIIGLIVLGVCLLLLLLRQELRASDPLLPPRVFSTSAYRTSTGVSTLSAMLMFICVFTIPLYFQLARGASAAESGIYVAPFMLSAALGNVIASRSAKFFGTVRVGLRVGAAMTCLGLIALALLPLTAPIWLVIVAMLVAGPGLGACMICSMMGAQNALVHRDIGSGTGAVLVLRSVGGAAGSTLAGALLASAMAAVHQTAAQGGSLASHGSIADHAAQGLLAVSQLLSRDFSTVYAVAAALAFISFTVALCMPNTPLRGSNHPVPIGE